MGFISGYPKDTSISLSDKLLGTDSENSLLTKNFEIGDFVTFLRTQDIGSEGPIGPQGIQGPSGSPGAVGPAGLTWRGSWISGTSYVANDAVGFGGASYFCILATSGTTTPNLATANWALLASQGAIGPSGAQGPTGPQGPSGGSLPYKESSSKISQVGANPISRYNSFIEEIFIGPDNSNPLYRDFYSDYVSVGTFEVGWFWFTGSTSAISTPKLDFSTSSDRIKVIAETNFSIGPYSGIKFTIETRDNSGNLSNDVLGFTNFYFRLFN